MMNTSTPARSESRLQVLEPPAAVAPESLPAWAAQQRREQDGAALCVANLPGPGGAPVHWLEAAHARGWIAPQANTPVEAAALQVKASEFLARGFVGADALLLAFLARDGALPRLSWGETTTFAAPRAPSSRRLDLYAVVDSAARLRAALDAGVRTVQLRIKRPPAPDAAWHARLREDLAQGIAAARACGAEFFVNDHWALAAELGADAVHLGQEDLIALGEAGRRQLLASGVALGISSHAVWELCRARALSPRYIACGPAWPTTTKDMPWLPQGLDNLAWWQRQAGAPVVAIGGILEPQQARQAAACGVDGVCLVRALGEVPAQGVPEFAQALAAGRAAPAPGAPDWPHPTLPHG